MTAVGIALAVASGAVAVLCGALFVRRELEARRLHRELERAGRAAKRSER